jgi:hypothetical protein
MQIVEREIYQRTGAVTVKVALEDNTAIPLPMITHILHGATNPINGLRPYRFIWLPLNMGMVLLATGVVGMGLLRVRPPFLQALTVALYVLLLLLFGACVWCATVRGHRTWLQAVERLPREWRKPIGQRMSKGRPLWQWLLMPRVNFQDTSKLLLIPAGWLLGWLATMVSFSFAESLLFFLVFELVVYQGRYAINDLIDRDIDDPDRNRFPKAAGQTGVRAGVLSIILRVAIWVSAALLVGGSVGRGLLASGIAVLMLTVPYEWLRTRTRRASKFVTAPTKAMLLLYVLVGACYGVRLTAGLWVGTSGEAAPVVLLAAFVAAWGLNISTVTMTWTLQATELLEVNHSPNCLYNQLGNDPR